MSADVARAPSPPHERYSSKRKRPDSRDSRRSPSPPPARRRRSISPTPRSQPSGRDAPIVSDVDPVRRRERERQIALRQAEAELEKSGSKENGRAKDPEFDAEAEFKKLISSKSGGVYMPPARLRALQAAAADDKSSPEYQRLSWDALRKSLTGIVNRVNVTNIKNVVPEMFSENLMRGRGLFARSIMKAQASSLPFTPVFAACIAIINSKLPPVGELVVIRLISQFRRSLKRKDKTVCVSSSMFICHLVNQRVASDLLVLEMLTQMLGNPTDDGVEVAVSIMREVGAFIEQNSPKATETIFAQFRTALHEQDKISSRVQYMIEVLFQVRKDKYKDNPILPEGLDLVEEEEQITHDYGLDDELPVQESLNVFKFDPNFLENEEKYKEMKAEILGSDDEDGESDGDDEDEDEEGGEGGEVAGIDGIQDRTGTNLVNLRRVIYLTIMNSLTYEEAVHKLMKVNIQEGEEIELCNMIVECCSQERSYSQFYGLIGERFAKLNRTWAENFEEAFANYFDTIHRYETNRLRNIARFFGHLMATDSISWAVLSVVKMNEDDTTSSSRIFIKILLQEMTEEMGLQTLTTRFKDPTLAEHLTQLFPMDNPKNTRFSINYFTSIGLGAVTEAMREHLKNAPQLIMAQRRALQDDTSSDSDSDSYTSSSDSTTSSSSYRSRRSYGRGRSRSRSRSHHRRSRSRSTGIVGAMLRGARRSLTPRHGGLTGLIQRARSRSVVRQLTRSPYNDIGRAISRSVSRSLSRDRGHRSYSRTRSRSRDRHYHPRRSRSRSHHRSRSRGYYDDGRDRYRDDYRDGSRRGGGGYDDYGYGGRGRRSSNSPPPPLRYIAPPIATIPPPGDFIPPPGAGYTRQRDFSPTRSHRSSRSGRSGAY